jgi:transcriptional repressor of dcmA and dcmR
MSDDELLDIKQAANFLNVSETSLRRWTNSGRLPCLRVGRRRERRFRRADLLAFAGQQPAMDLRDGSTGSSDAPQGHVLAVHGDDGGRSELAAPFLAGGLAEGGACFLVASPVIQREISHRLHERYPIARTRIGGGYLTLSEFAGSVERQIDYFESHFEEALRRGITSLYVVGDSKGVKNVVGREGLIDYEALYDARISRRYPVATLCLYDVRESSASELFGALKLHPDTFRYPTGHIFA